MKKSQLIAGMIVIAIVVLVVTQLATDSLNPLEVFRGDSLFLKIVIGFFLFVLLMQLLSLTFLGKKFTNVNCRGCGNDILLYVQSHGAPMNCPMCKRPFHKTCYNQKATSLLSGCRREGCPSAVPDY